MHRPVVGLVGSKGSIGKVLQKELRDYQLITDEDYLQTQSNRTQYDLSRFDVAYDRVKYHFDFQPNFDSLVILVGRSNSKRIEFDNPTDRWRYFFDSNFFSVINLIEALCQLRLERQSDSDFSVVVASSICGLSFMEGAPIEYAVAKSALNSSIVCLSKRYQQTRVRVNGLVLGHVSVEGSVWDSKNIQEQREALGGVPIGSFCSIHDIKSAVEYLISEKSRYVTGALLKIDGGASVSF